MRSERGVSLVEATIILAVMAILASVIAPSIASYTNDAKAVAAKEDVEAIGSGILQLLRDTGSRCLKLAGSNTTLTDCTTTNRVDLLYSGGADPVSVTAADITVPDQDAVANQATFNWIGDSNAPLASTRDTVDDQLIENDNVTPYPTPAFTVGGPRMKLGWRGAYVNGPVTGDPWGTMYQANTIFLTVATNATDAGGNQTQEGLRETGWNRDVLVVSAGGNRDVETSFGGVAVSGIYGGVAAGGDDIIYVIKGGTR